jgi:F0F1-type ATP synthase membrane subunit b/b'
MGWRVQAHGHAAAQEGHQSAMSTSRPKTSIREELKLVEEDLAQLRETASSLREQIGERADGPIDPEEHAAMIESAEEQEFLIEQLEARREELLAELGGRSSGAGENAGP